VTALGFFDHTPAKLDDVPVWISRTGFTGDLGYEVFCDAADANTVWDTIFEAARRTACCRSARPRC
jgi:aminomethyltransferase